MREDIASFVAACSVCAQAKVPHRSPQGLLQPLPIPHRPWSHIALDYVTGLPPSHHHTTILTIVDRFSKAVHFIPLTKLPSASETAQLLITHVIRLHGIPTDIVSDRGPKFTARFWRAFCTLIGTTISLSSGFHPQTNGQTERANQSLETVLRCLCANNPASWSTVLPWAEYAINSHTASASKLSPFECCLLVSQPRAGGGSLVGGGVRPAVQAHVEGHAHQPGESSSPDEGAGGGDLLPPTGLDSMCGSPRRTSS